ncbi:MBL fold metallo-hydrolase [Streptomyces sp. NPDC046887]|uniref:MBL fold metallo-hydrolase n=1 Tax=Streptomyces sp. NPDC046887 TaxID=3155472 RepID=UPI0033F418B5
MTTTVHRLDYGHFLRPAEEAGLPHARAEALLGYLVRHPGGTLLFDTGMGADPETDAHYRPTRRELDVALADVGARRGEVDVVVNCHLHFDHCGGNPLFLGVPVLAQRKELLAARAVVDYTLGELIEAPGVRYEELEGEAEVWPGVRVVPTPGHTEGHQSLVVEGVEGATVLAGQAFDTASEFAAAEMSRRAGGAGGPWPGWLDRFAELGARRVLFAHDRSVWEGP